MTKLEQAHLRKVLRVLDELSRNVMSLMRDIDVCRVEIEGIINKAVLEEKEASIDEFLK